jgi:predicted metal-dependent hydrolase
MSKRAKRHLPTRPSRGGVNIALEAWAVLTRLAHVAKVAKPSVKRAASAKRSAPTMRCYWRWPAGLAKAQLSWELPALTDTEWVDIRIRKQANARRLTLRVRAADQVTLTVPVRTSARVIERCVHTHALWLQSALQRVRLTPPRTDEIALPATWHLTALGCDLSITTLAVSQAVPNASDSGNPARLHALWRQQRALRCRDARLLISTAVREPLERLLAAQAARLGVHYKKLQLGWPKSRWGSCSTRGTIRLNVAAVFLTPAQLQYLLIHELAHLREPNHSPKFWACVASVCPDYRQLDGEIKRAYAVLPTELS